MKKIFIFCAFFLLSALYVFSQNGPKSWSISITGSSSVCIGSSVTLTSHLTGNGPTPYHYKWYKNGIPTSSADTLYYYFINQTQISDTGNYTVKLLWNSDSTLSSNHHLNVLQYDNISLSSPVGTQYQTVCMGDTIAPTVYTFNGGSTSVYVSGLSSSNYSINNTNKTITISGLVTSSTLYTITTFPSLCFDTISGSISISTTPVLNLDSGQLNNSVCAGSPLDIIIFKYGCASAVIVNGLPAGLNTYTDTLNKTLTITGSPSQSGNYTYTVTAISAFPGIYTSLSGTITVDTLPAISQISGVNSVCGNQKGITYEIDNIAGAEYVWEVDGGIISDGENLPKVTINWGTVSMIGKIKVTVTGNNGCKSTDSIQVSISQINAIDVGTIVAKINTEGLPYILIYPNPPEVLYYQWYKNNNAIPGANEQFYHPASVGMETSLDQNAQYSVYVALLANPECGNFTDPYIWGNKSFMFSIYPNPNNGIFSLSFNNEEIDVAGSVIDLYSLDGKNVYKLTINNPEEMKISLALRKGFYFAKLTTVDGNIYIGKLIVR